MAGLGKFLGGVASGGLIAGLTLVIASQWAQPSGGRGVEPEQVNGGVARAQDAAPVLEDREQAAAEVPAVSDVPVKDSAAPVPPEAAAPQALAPAEQPAAETAAIVPPAAEPAAPAVAAPEVPLETAAVSDTPPAAPVTVTPAQSAPVGADIAPVPQAEAAGTLTAQLQAPPVVAGTDAAPANAELPPPPPLTEQEEAILADPTRLALPAAPDEAAVAVPEADVPAETSKTNETAEAAVVSPVIEVPEQAPEPAPDPAPAAESEAVATPVAPATAVQEPSAAPEVGFAADGPSTLPAAPQLITQGEGSLIDRNAAKADAAAAEPAIVLAESAPADATALQRFAADFVNPDNKPLFAIVLVDTGEPGLDRQAVASLPFAVSIVIDPLMQGAADHAALYRAGGKEVIMLASGIPDGATAADVEQTFQAHAGVLPEAVAVIDSADAMFQNDRPLSTQIVAILAAQGRGLLTWDRGLNAADQVARREGLPTATIFRQIDAEAEGVPVMRRYLDRAAFKAAQEGEAIVLGTIRPETIAALLEWTIEGRASTVALAPASAILQAD